VMDATHGIDVVRWDRPEEGPLSIGDKRCTKANGCKPKTQRAPVRSEWRLSPTAGLPNGNYGLACRLDDLT